MNVYELNLDGLVGPTHHYAGLAYGNVASSQNALSKSNPQAAARQGIEKMRLLFNMGLKQGILPPHQRPNLKLLHQLGFHGTPSQQIEKAYQTAPELLSASFSASSMWTANAATVSPSIDTQDNKTHFTTANLISNLHRHQEAHFSHHLFKFLFANPDFFKHHDLLPYSAVTGDEGAANHNRLCKSHSHQGIHLFVYGRQALGNIPTHLAPIKYPARQTKEACQAIVRKHLLKDSQIVLAQQNPQVIDQGVFHNDVISVANESVFLVHESAFHNHRAVIDELCNKASFPLNIIEISQEQLSIQDAVKSYLFNSQIITLPTKNEMMLLAPSECKENPDVQRCINEIISNSNNPINSVHYLDLRQSMRNGGGPACLRLRVPLNTNELAAMHQHILVDNNLLDTLDSWVLKHYRTELAVADLIDPLLINENFQALDELTQILRLGSIYPFQM